MWNPDNGFECTFSTTGDLNEFCGRVNAPQTARNWQIDS